MQIANEIASRIADLERQAESATHDIELERAQLAGAEQRLAETREAIRQYEALLRTITIGDPFVPLQKVDPAI